MEVLVKCTATVTLGGLGRLLHYIQRLACFADELWFFIYTHKELFWDFRAVQ